MRKKLQDSIPNLQTVAGLFKSLAGNFPVFERETEFIGLSDPSEYALYDGQLASTDTGIAPLNEYLTYTNEYIVPQSTAKWAKHNRESYMVGALARLNLNYKTAVAAASAVLLVIVLSRIVVVPRLVPIAPAPPPPVAVPAAAVL